MLVWDPLQTCFLIVAQEIYPDSREPWVWVWVWRGGGTNSKGRRRDERPLQRRRNRGSPSGWVVGDATELPLAPTATWEEETRG